MSMTGVNAILRSLGSVKTAMQRGLFIKAVEDWARIEFIPRAKALAAVDTGNLRDSITFEASANQVFVFAGAAYASHVEFGTFSHRAQPFIRPAYNAARKKLSVYTRQAIREAIK